MKPHMQKLLSKMYVRKRVLLVPILVFLTYVLLLGIVTPRILQKKLPAWASHVLTKPLSVNNISINPLTLNITISDITIHEADSSILSIDRVFVHFSPLTSLAKQEIHLGAVVIDSLRFHVEHHKDGTFNFENLFIPRKSKTTHKKPLPIGFGTFSFNQGLLSFQNHLVMEEKPIHFAPINFEVHDFSTKKTVLSPNHIDIFVKTPEGAKINITGDVQLSPLKIHGTISMNEYDLTSLYNKVGEHLNFIVSKGKINLTTHYVLEKFSVQGQPPIKFSLSKGEASIDSLLILEKRDSSTILNLHKLALYNVGLATAGSRYLKADSLVLLADKFEADLESDGILNLKKSFNFKPLVAAYPALKKLGGKFKYYFFNIKDVTILFNDFEYRDETFKDPIEHSLTDFVLSVHNIYKTPIQDTTFKGNKHFLFDLNSSYNLTGSVALHGVGSITPFSMDAELGITQAAIHSFQGLLSTIVASKIEKGSLSCDLLFSHHPTTKKVPLSFKGVLSLDDVYCTNTLDGSAFAAIKRVHLDTTTISLTPFAISSRRVNFYNPTVYLSINNKGQINVVSMRQARDSRLFKKEKSHKFRVNYELDTLYLKNFNAEVHDLSLIYSFTTKLHNLDGLVTGFSTSPQAKINFNLKGNVDNYTAIRLEGYARPFIPEPDLAFTFYARGFELPTFSPYTATYAGIPIIHGSLETTLKYFIRNDSIWGENRIVLDNVEFGEKVKSDKKALSIPLKLAVGILRDNDGITTLDATIVGSLKDPQFNLANLIWEAIGKGLGKAIASPFTALAKAAHKKEIEYIDFSEGSFSITFMGAEKLQEVKKIVDTHKNIRIKILGLCDEKKDGIAIKQNTLIKKMGFKLGMADVNARNITSPIYRGELLKYYSKISGVSWEKEFALYTKNEMQNESKQQKKREKEELAVARREELLTDFATEKFNMLTEKTLISPQAINEFCQARAQVVYNTLIKEYHVPASNLSIVSKVDERVKNGTYAYLSADLRSLEKELKKNEKRQKKKR